MKTESLVNILDEVRAWTVNTNGLTPEEVSLNVTLFIDRIEAAYKREADDYKGRIKLWCDRADELRRKCDEQYAELKHLRN